MKFAVNFVLFMFMLFLSTPTIVSVIEKGCDTSYFYSMSEEELSHKEIKADCNDHSFLGFIDLSDYTSSLIHSENRVKHDNIASTIFIPPPEQV